MPSSHRQLGWLRLSDIEPRLSPITFRKVENQVAYQRTLECLRRDVEKHGGTSSETVEIHHTLWDLTISCSPHGLILIRKPVTVLEALAAFFQAD